MEPKLIESIHLDNGLTLEIMDFSRKVAADRWLVKLVARIEIDVTDHGFSDKLPLPAPSDQLEAKLGDRVHHEYHVERNFVDNLERDVVLNQMHASVVKKTAYYGHPDFAARLIIKEYAARQYIPAASDTPKK